MGSAECPWHLCEPGNSNNINQQCAVCRVVAVTDQCDYPPEARSKPQASVSAVDSSLSSDQVCELIPPDLGVVSGFERSVECSRQRGQRVASTDLLRSCWVPALSQHWPGSCEIPALSQRGCCEQRSVWCPIAQQAAVRFSCVLEAAASRLSFWVQVEARLQELEAARGCTCM